MTTYRGRLTRRLWLLGSLVALMGGGGAAQDPDARTIVQEAARTMGADRLRSIQVSGRGWIGVTGQNYTPADDWPRLDMPRYTRTIDYEARSSREERVITQGNNPARGGGGMPIQGEQRQVWMVSGPYAWDLRGTDVVPQPALAEQRQLDIWLTPHGCLKAAMAPGANPTAAVRFEGSGAARRRLTAVSFVTLGKYRVQCVLNDEHLVVRVQTWLPSPVVGDMYYEMGYGNYKDFGGVKFPTGPFHGHHDLDDDLEGLGPNVSGGHNALGFDSITNVVPNVSNAALTVPDEVRKATVPPVRVESQKLADGVWYLGGGSHASVAVEFADFVAVVEAPLNEARSLAVIAEVRKLTANKPIRYLVNTHHHWDHLGGVRTYIHDEGVTILTYELNREYYKEVLWVRPWTLQPDRLALHPSEEVAEGYTFEPINEKHVVSDRTRTLEIYTMNGLAHVQGMLIAYLPAEKIVVEADMFTPPSPGAPLPAATAANRTFYNNVRRLGLDVTTIAPIHGGRAYPWADFVKIVETGTN